MKLGLDPGRSAGPPEAARARCRPASIATSVASLAVPWMTPPPVLLVERKESGRPMARPSQSSTRVSISVQAGEVCQSMPCTPRPVERRSPRIAGPEELAGKNAKKWGDCQGVSPGRTMRWTSAMIASQGSGFSGAASGRLAATLPGATDGSTGSVSTVSR